MCGRFLLTAPVEALRRLFGVMELPNLGARYNIAPTQDVPVVRVKPDSTQSGDRELVMLRWGLIPSWAKDATIAASLINARGESVAEKPAFRAAFRQRRCLVPADGFYEWKATSHTGAKGKPAPKQPYLIRRRDQMTFAFAGLWEHWRGDGKTGPLETFTIITTDANADIAAIHHRMPVILDPADYGAWLDTGNKEAGALLRPAPLGALEAVPISTRVNAVRNDDASLIEPVAADEPAPAPRPAPPAQGRLF